MGLRTTSAALPEEAPTDEAQLALAASGQKLAIYSIIASLVLSAAARGVSMPALLVWALYIVIAVVSLVGVVRICSGLGKGTHQKLVFMVLSFVPLANLIALVFLSVKTTRLLRSHGWDVGLLGLKS